MLAGVTALVLLVVFYYPVATVFVESVVVAGRVTLDAFGAVFTDSFYVGWLAALVADPVAFAGRVARDPTVLAGSLGLLGFTAYQALLSTVASVALGLPGAWILSRFEFRGRETIRSLTILPFVLPSIMVAIGFVATFGRNGTLNGVLRALGLGEVSLLFTLEAVIVAHAFYNAPLVARVTTAAWESVDARTVETARSLGANPRTAFRHVIAPQLYPAVLMGATLTFVFTFASFPIVLALGGLQLATVEVWIYSLVRDLEYTEAAALAVIETGISLLLTYAYLRYEARRETKRRGSRPLPRRRLWPGRDALTPGAALARLAVAGYGLAVLVVFVGPLASMVAASLTTGDGALTLGNFAFLLERQATGASFQVKPLPAVLNSLALGVVTLALALPMGMALSVLTTRPYRGRTLVDALTMAPLAVSGIVVGLGMLRGLVFGVVVFGYRVTVTGWVAIAVAHAVAAYPFVVRTVAPMIGDLDRAMVESARSLGASRVRALWDVELPLVWPGVVAGAAFAFAISIGEFDSTVILAQGSGAYTMPVAVERYIGRRLGPATAMGVVLLCVTAGSFVVIERFGGRIRNR